MILKINPKKKEVDRPTLIFLAMLPEHGLSFCLAWWVYSFDDDETVVEQK